jgi:hypothetical protein
MFELKPIYLSFLPRELSDTKVNFIVVKLREREICAAGLFYEANQGARVILMTSRKLIFAIALRQNSKFPFIACKVSSAFMLNDCKFD